MSIQNIGPGCEHMRLDLGNQHTNPCSMLTTPGIRMGLDGR